MSAGRASGSGSGSGSGTDNGAEKAFNTAQSRLAVAVCGYEGVIHKHVKKLDVDSLKSVGEVLLSEINRLRAVRL